MNEELLGSYGPALAFAGLGLSGASVLLSGYLVYKLRQVHRTLYRTDLEVGRLSEEITRTLQSERILTHELGIGRPLPLMRGWAASPDVLLVLLRQARRARPRTMVECGSGVSTLVLAQAARLNGSGRVLSLDHDAGFAARTREALRDYGLSDWATVIDAPLVEQELEGRAWRWYDLSGLPAEPAIDLLFVDGPPADAPAPLSRYPAGPRLFPRLAPGASVIVDDAARPGEQEIVSRWLAAFPALERREHPAEKGCIELALPEARPESAGEYAQAAQ